MREGAEDKSHGTLTAKRKTNPQSTFLLIDELKVYRETTETATKLRCESLKGDITFILKIIKCKYQKVGL